jgi:hypothetical protein
MKKIATLFSIIIFLSSCLTGVPKGTKQAITHQEWTTLLKKHVNEAGLVDYKSFIKDSVALNKYLAKISDNAPASSWSSDEKFAYWINAYNAYTVKLIADNYPVKSIKDLAPKNAVIFINTTWDKKFFSIDGKKMTLNTIEHKILRKRFNDPRMHFAINCASMSCPKLLNEAYEAKTLDKQLTAQAKDFLSDTKKNKVSKDNPELSSIFDWFNKDFTKTGKTKIGFINQYAPVKINENASLKYMSYDWSLNDQK